MRKSSSECALFNHLWTILLTCSLCLFSVGWLSVRPTTDRAFHIPQLANITGSVLVQRYVLFTGVSWTRVVRGKVGSRSAIEYGTVWRLVCIRTTLSRFVWLFWCYDPRSMRVIGGLLHIRLSQRGRSERTTCTLWPVLDRWRSTLQACNQNTALIPPMTAVYLSVMRNKYWFAKLWYSFLFLLGFSPQYRFWQWKRWMVLYLAWKYRYTPLTSPTRSHLSLKYDHSFKRF